MSQLPTHGNLSRIALTGFGNPVQLPGGACKSVIIAARRVISGLSGGASTANGDAVLIGVGVAPTILTAYTGIALLAGETIEINVADSSFIYVDGANGDSVTVTRLL